MKVGFFLEKMNHFQQNKLRNNQNLLDRASVRCNGNDLTEASVQQDGSDLTEHYFHVMAVTWQNIISI